MITNAQEPKGRGVLLFWIVILVMGYFWSLPKLGQLSETLPTPDVLDSSSSPPSAAERKTRMLLNDPGRYGHIVPIGPEEQETPQRIRMQLNDPGRYGPFVPIGPEEQETPKRSLR